MDVTHSGTYEYLLRQYSPLLTLNHVAELVHSTPNGVRMAISRKNQAFALGLASAKRRLGRRVYFEARRVAEIIDHDIQATDKTIIDLDAVSKQRSL